MTYSKDNVITMPNKYFTHNEQGQIKFNHHLLKAEILEEIPIYRTDIGIVRYQNGVYKRSLNADILHIIQQKIGTLATMSRKRETLDLILHENNSIPLSQFNNGKGILQLLNLKNGIYNIQTKAFQPHSKYFHWTIQQPINYDPEAKCPHILEFLHDLFNEDEIQFIIEWLAYCCLPNADPDKILFFYGSGGNGKSTVLNVFKAFLGLENITNMSLRDLTDDKFSRAHLYGKLANICGDIDNHVINNTGIIKSLTGSEDIYAQFKGVDGFSFQSFAKLMYSANDLPMSTDKTEGYFRRLFILPFEKKVPEEKKIPMNVLLKKLTTSTELSGLLNLVITAIHKLKANNYKFTIPESAERALEEYKNKHDKVAQFIDEECLQDVKKKVTLKHFYHAYVDWCKIENNIMPEQKRKVKEKLLQKGFVIEKGAGNKDYIFGLIFSKNSAFNIEQ